MSNQLLLSLVLATQVDGGGLLGVSVNLVSDSLKRYFQSA